MKTYNFSVMSIDPMENEDDNSQKYSKSASGKNIDEAKEIVLKEFKDKQLPVFWIKENI